VAIGKIDQFPITEEFIVYINKATEKTVSITRSSDYEANIETFKEFTG
jgi:hypothetical protein